MAESLPAPLRSTQVVRGKLKVALDLIVFEGLKVEDAAKRAGIQPAHVYSALEKPYVLQYVRKQRKVLRESISGRATHRMVELSEQSKSLPAAVSATKALMVVDEPEAIPGSGVNLGISFLIADQRAPDVQVWTPGDKAKDVTELPCEGSDKP
jgi:hypothetical protein